MKSHIFLLLLGLSLTSIGCLKDTCTETRTFVEFEPIYRSQAQLDLPTVVESPRALEDPGIIYFYKDYILINERQRGIHVINNSDKQNPVNEAFLNIDGNEHFAVIDDHLQANKFNALLTLDISDVKNPVERSRIKNVFQEVWEDPARGFLVGYQRTNRTTVLDCSDPNFNSVRWRNGRGGPILMWNNRLEANVDFISTADQASGSDVGIGGSTARFTIAANHLYAVSDFDMKVFDVNDAGRPALKNTINLGWGIETIYPFKDNLFIGSNTGMQIFDIGDPASPRFQSSFQHARACDPVVADDNTAFVTLRDGSMCEGFNNQLDVIDIENLLTPHLITSYRMDNPHGLALDGTTLYVCEGDFGFKVLDVSQRRTIKEIKNYKDIRSTDVIALPNNHLLIIGKDGFKQYDAKDPKKLKLLSEIPVQGKS